MKQPSLFLLLVAQVATVNFAAQQETNNPSSPAPVVAPPAPVVAPPAPVVAPPAPVVAPPAPVVAPPAPVVAPPAPAVAPPAPAVAPPAPVAGAETYAPATKSVPAAAESAVPVTLLVEVAAIRFKPLTKEQILDDFQFSGTTANVIETLRTQGRTVDVIYRGVRDLIPDQKAKACFDATEARPVMLVGQPAAQAPAATAFGLKLELTAKPAPAGRFALFWEGNLVWSPELMDRRVDFQNTLVFASKAATAAEKASHQLTSDGTVQQAADIGLALAQVFAPSDKSANGSIYELPVVKTVGLTGSRYCRSGDLVVLSTAAEAGAKEPQTVFLLVRLALKE